MTFHVLIRRLHLYLGLFLLPWFFMYGVSSIPFSHNGFFQKIHDDGVPEWKVRFERPYEIEVADGADHLQEVGAKIVKDAGLEGTFGTYRQNARQLNVYFYSFWHSVRLTYFIDQKRLLAEDKRFRWDHFLTGMHARGGFQHASFLNDAWAVVIDLVCVGFILWIATGIYMWWLLPQSRHWGWLALAGGALAFLGFLWAL